MWAVRKVEIPLRVVFDVSSSGTYNAGKIIRNYPDDQIVNTKKTISGCETTIQRTFLWRVLLRCHDAPAILLSFFNRRQVMRTQE